MLSYQQKDIESEEVPLLFASPDVTSEPKSSRKLFMAVAASLTAVLLTTAAMLKSDEIQTAFSSLWTGSTTISVMDGGTRSLDRHPVACDKNAALHAFRLQCAPGWKYQENFECAPVTLGVSADTVFAETPFNEDGGGNHIYLDRHDVSCSGNYVLNSFRYVLHPNFFKGDPRTHYEYTCINTGGPSGVATRYTTWEGGGGGNLAFLDRALIGCPGDELLQGFRYQRNPNNGDEYRYVMKCKSMRPLVPQVSKLPVCLFLHGAMVKGARPTVFKSHHGEILGSGRTYWGAFNDWYADVCDEFVYGWARTTDKAFDDSELMNSYSDKALEVIGRGGIVIAHSMANAILAAACWKLNKCAQWYSLGGGYSGQAIGPAILSLMESTNFVTIPYIGVGGSDVTVGIDVIKRFVSTVVFDGFRYDKTGMRLDGNKDTKNAMAKNVDKLKLLKGSICGVSPKGNGVELDKYQVKPLNILSTTFQAERWKDQAFLGGFMDFAANQLRTKLYETKHADDRSDGLVELAACAFWSDDVTDPSKNNWYGIGKEWPEYGPFGDHNKDDTHILARINHVEECGIFPETGSGIALKWIRNMMCREIESSQGNKCSDAPQGYNWPDPKGKLGDICTVDTDCEGWKFDPTGLFPKTGCCMWELHMMCSNKLKDYAGFYYCPADCVGNPWANAQSDLKGTCEQMDTKLHWPRIKDEPCVVHTDCENYSLQNPGLACCDRQCKDKKRDWAGGYFCPGECKGKPWLNGGTC